MPKAFDCRRHLIAEGILSLDQYLELRNNYLRRNKYLYIFKITAPRTFGETWAQRHLNELVPELDIPSNKYDETYSGQYDFWYDGIRIEVKASRAVSRKSGGTLLEKALSINSENGFDMNFQQIKPACADVFVWIAVWRDAIRYWHYLVMRLSTIHIILLASIGVIPERGSYG